MKFTGTKDYVATDDLKVAVNASIVLERPLLIKGEPGTGKTVLARHVAEGLGMEGVEFGITDVAAPLERDGHVDDASEMLGGGALPR